MIVICQDIQLSKGKDIKSSQIAKTRSLHRLIPIEKTCVATLGAINEKLEPLLEAWLGKDKPARSYAIAFKRRNNSAVKRQDIHTLVNGTVRAPHTVDLSNPDITIVIEVVNVCCFVVFCCCTKFVDMVWNQRHRKCFGLWF